MSEGTRYLPPLGRHEMDAIVVYGPEDKERLARQLKDKGLDKDLYPVFPGQVLAGRRFRIIYMTAGAYHRRSHSPRDLEMFDQWFDHLRCRLTREGQIIDLPS